MKPASLSLFLAVFGLSTGFAADPLPREAKAAADKALAYMRSISTGGGWVWRYSLDLKERAGEGKATPTMIWIQPPGTPTMGMALLRAYEATRDPRYLDAAKAAADGLAIGQLESGGWDYSVNFDPEQAKRAYRRTDKGTIPAAEAAKRFNVSTYDDDNTQSATMFLMAVVDASKGGNDARDQRIRAARDYALVKMLEAQFPNGAWPQRYDGVPKLAKDFPVLKAGIPKVWPREWPKPDYKHYYTLNDNTLSDCIAVMLDAHHRYGKPEYLAAAKKAGDFLLLAQLPEPQPAWAQQYNQRMEPAWARAFEPPAVTGGESGGAVRTLVDLFIETGEQKYLEPIPRVIAWWKRSEIAPGRWARYYELGSNKPIYGDRDGKIYYRLDQISEERRNGYGWEGGFNVGSATRAYEQAVKEGRDALLKKRQPRPMTDKQKASRAKELEPKVREIIAALDTQGRWVTKGRFSKESKGLEFSDRVETQVFIQNLGVLSDYLEATRTE
jgi:PelA/Pel-15E family pectate lyase